MFTHCADSCEAHGVVDTYLKATGSEELGVIAGVGVVEAEQGPWGRILGGTC